MPDEFEDLENMNLSARRENRAAAMQYIYMCEMNSREHTPEYLDEFLSRKPRERSFYAFAEELIAGVFAHKKSIDETVSKYAQNWALPRICKVDLSILRIAIFEIFHRDDIPAVVSINEAIELSKMFSGADSKRFINGVLDKIKESAPAKSSNKR